MSSAKLKLVRDNTKEPKPAISNILREEVERALGQGEPEHFPPKPSKGRRPANMHERMLMDEFDSLNRELDSIQRV